MIQHYSSHRHPSWLHFRADMPDSFIDHDCIDACEPAQVPTGSTWSYVDRGQFIAVGHGVRVDQSEFDACFPVKPDGVKGGRRPGSGRKALDELGTVVTTVRLTGKQRATLDMLGGVTWLRGQLDLFGG